MPLPVPAEAAGLLV